MSTSEQKQDPRQQLKDLRREIVTALCASSLNQLRGTIDGAYRRSNIMSLATYENQTLEKINVDEWMRHARNWADPNVAGDRIVLACDIAWFIKMQNALCKIDESVYKYNSIRNSDPSFQTEFAEIVFDEPLGLIKRFRAAALIAKCSDQCNAHTYDGDFNNV